MSKEAAVEIEPREIDALIAERLFGWEWFERVDNSSQKTVRKVLYPPECDEWVRYNFSDLVWRPARPETERFSDWDECCRRRGTEDMGLPCFSTDISSALEIVEKLWVTRKLNVVMSDGRFHNGWIVEFATTDAMHVFSHEGEADTLPRAICLAALEVIEKS